MRVKKFNVWHKKLKQAEYLLSNKFFLNVINYLKKQRTTTKSFRFSIPFERIRTEYSLNNDHGHHGAPTFHLDDNCNQLKISPRTIIVVEKVAIQ